MLDTFILNKINEYAAQLEKKLQGDILYYYGPTHPLLVKPFRDLIERMASESSHKKICIFLKTGGGQVEPVEKMVDILRFHYETVWFFVPDFAMSAGTVFCMSGDKIFMDYSSSLGPIDPQVTIKDNGVDKLVPALGVLEQVEQLIEKSKNGSISPAEFAILQSQNLALLSSYEHAKDLSIDLAVNWLVEYKFKNWQTHRTDAIKHGKAVTLEEKIERAKEIVTQLADHKLWHSHGRFISAKMLHEKLRLEIDNYPDDAKILIRSYNDLLTDFIEQKNYPYYMHEKNRIG
ncbi:TPA: ATP-dependent Clp protease proteolytic subunit [Legionella pneumophila]|nr:serine dehydrogenasease [Legionella pneumophila]HAU1630320.1 serine dehydrogenasease [Legionella pneumophila]HCC0380809.1 ATP-dependent Clp protease proteolytic subunit [Legionella pneumophila]HEB4957846.1 ATP-dependent Clp protease proteolytic subunit [Legionella pneumophila]HEB4962301.1 ATP-dependent Clp protease proteolytic subunit [Legionella pneumophila]